MNGKFAVRRSAEGDVERRAQESRSTLILTGRTGRSQDVIVRALMATLLLGAFAAQSVRGFRRAIAGDDPWLTGDWLVSYAGGFIRRGLFGFLLGIGSPTQQRTVITLWLIQVLLYAVLFAVVMRWALCLPSPTRWVPLFLSPAFLLFSLHDFQGSHRKEIIGLVALAIMVESVRAGRFCRTALGVALILLLIGAFSHEINALFVPALIGVAVAAFRASLITMRQLRAFIGGSAAIGGLALLLSVLRPGDSETVAAVCSDLIGRGFEESVCGGAIGYLGFATSDAFASVGNRLPGQLLFVVVGIFAIAGLRLSTWFRQNTRLIFAVCGPFFLLYPVGMDWGRWIMVQATVATFFVVLGEWQQRNVPDRLPWPFVLVYVLCWRAPHIAISSQAIASNGLLELPEVLYRALSR